MTLEGKKIGFGITASFCTVLKILEPLQMLKDAGADIYPVVSDNVSRFSSRFHDRDSFLEKVRHITGKREINTIAEAETFGPDNKMDAMVIAPATGNTIGKLANGITDAPVLMASKATLRNNRPLVLAMYTNDALGMSGVNIMKLYNLKNIYFVPFGQDDPFKKPTSMTSNLFLLNKTIEKALDGKQIQPAIITF